MINLKNNDILKKQVIYPELERSKFRLEHGCWNQTKLNPSDLAKPDSLGAVATSIPNGSKSAMKKNDKS